MELIKDLVRIIARAFYTTEHALIIDALVIHSTLTDEDLAHVLGIPHTKTVRRLCGQLREDGLISVQTRGERKEGAPPIVTQGKHGAGQSKERLFYRDWYYLNYHRTVDSIKYRLWRLSKHIESLDAPTTEKKDLVCPRCKSSFTELEVMDNISATGDFLCHVCYHVLDHSTQDDIGEKESMKRLNNQLSHIVGIMRQIDATDVPENDFDKALLYALPVQRGEFKPARRVHIVDNVQSTITSSHGMTLAPEVISVTVTQDGSDAISNPGEATRKRFREAQQNALPEWISRSTISGDVTSVGAQEAAQTASTEAFNAELNLRNTGEQAKIKDQDNGILEAYWVELKAEQLRQAEVDMEEASENEESEVEEDDNNFDDINISI